MSPQKGCRFYMVYQFFWEELGLRGANKEVYAVIFGLSSSFQGVAKVSIGDICALTGLSKLSVMKSQEYRSKVPKDKCIKAQKYFYTKVL